jgi:hypothetical protein
MTITQIRTDVPYLRRRLKKGETNPNSSTQASASTSLKLGGSSLSLGNKDNTGSIPVVAEAVKPDFPPLPSVEGKVILSLEEPSVLLSKVQSAVGSLQISGAEAFAWEANDGFGNLVLADGNDSTAPVYGGRHLVEFHKGELVVGLRHFRNLRRLIVGTRTGMLRAKLYDESEIIADGGQGSNALLISRVGNQLEFRLEKINSVDLLGVFGVQVLP